MRWCLEVALEVHDEWMINDRENFLFTLHMIDLLQLDNGALLEAFERQWVFVLPITPMFDKTHTTERASSQRRQDMKVVQI